MRFANIDVNTIGIRNHTEKLNINLGDGLQILAIDNMYKKMGLDDSEIVRLSLYELSSYDGEYLILPFNHVIGVPTYSFFSKKIIPVFLGLSRDLHISNTEIEYLRKFQPIGCRDEITNDTMYKYNVDSYLNGCLTATFNKRENVKTNSNSMKTVFIDVSENIMNSAPDEGKKDSINLSNEFYDYIDNILRGKSLGNFILDRYEYLKNTASLVVTSRLHVASPCIAMGIPVIFAVEKIDSRMAWIDKYIPIYIENNIEEIDWNPKPIEFENEKNTILELAISRVKSTYEKHRLQCSVSEFYEKRSKSEYQVSSRISECLQFIKNWISPLTPPPPVGETKKQLKYAFWGIGDPCDIIYDYFQKNLPESELVFVCDTYKRTEYRGLKTISPEQIDFTQDIFIFVTGYGATSMAYHLFKQNNFPPNKYYLFFKPTE